MGAGTSSGISSPCAEASSIQSSIASLILVSASSSVSPSLIQPGKLGTSTVYPPVSSGIRTTCRMDLLLYRRSGPIFQGSHKCLHEVIGECAVCHTMIEGQGG